MAKSTETTTPDTPDTDRALPPGRATSPAPRPESKPVPAPRARAGGVGAGGNGGPADPEEMRQEIERTRARMSSTLDAVEARLAYERESLERKKDEIVDLATLKRVRETLGREPWRSVALAFVAGYVIAAIRD